MDVKDEGSKRKLKDKSSAIDEERLRTSKWGEASNEACRGHDLLQGS